MTTNIPDPARSRQTDLASTVWHRVLRCKYCGERLGTDEALRLHKPRPADKRSRQLKATGKVRRSLCASERTMRRAGAWRGHGGIWWTIDGGWNDATEGMPIVGPQAFENKGANLDKIADLASAIPENRKPHNGAGFGGSVSKFRTLPEGVQ